MSLEKINRIRAHDKFNEVDAVFITKSQNITYILGFKIESDTFIMIPRENMNNGDIWIFLNALEYDQVKMMIEKDRDLSKIVVLKQIPPGKPKFVHKSIKKMKLNTIGIEDDYISVKKYKEWKKEFSNPNFIGVSEIINRARIIKTRNEIERVKKAAELGDIGFKTIFESIEVGMTEKELAAEAEYAMRKAGSDGTSFDTIVASGERSAYPHAKTSDREIKDGDIIIVDIGAKYNEYCSDMTRTFIFGKKSKEKIKLVNLVNDGQKYALDNIKAGINCKDIDKLTRNFFIKKNKELGSRFIHGLGHGVGIDIHEDPYLTSNSQHTLEENMLVTCEPGLYVPGLGGARTEDLLVIKEEGVILLTHSKKHYY